MTAADRRRFVKRALRIVFLFGLGAFAAVEGIRALRVPYGWMAAAAMAIVAAFGAVHGHREVRRALLPFRVRRKLAAAPARHRLRTFDERAEVWREVLRLFHDLFAEEAHGGDDGAPPSDLCAAAAELMAEFIDAYAAGDTGQRARLRKLFAIYDQFGRAVDLGPVDSADTLRRHLIRYALVDQHPDWRDEAVVLGETLAAADESGIDAAPVLREVAEMASSDADAPGRSTRQVLLDAARGR
jgi:hypothetical protein